jgi:hypothetical protein
VVLAATVLPGVLAVVARARALAVRIK